LNHHFRSIIFNHFLIVTIDINVCGMDIFIKRDSSRPISPSVPQSTLTVEAFNATKVNMSRYLLLPSQNKPTDRHQAGTQANDLKLELVWATLQNRPGSLEARAFEKSARTIAKRMPGWKIYSSAKWSNGNSERAVRPFCRPEDFALSIGHCDGRINEP
jgi:hypothetical protein